MQTNDAIDRLHEAQHAAAIALLCPDCAAVGAPDCPYCIAWSSGVEDFEAGLDTATIDIPRVLHQPAYARGVTARRMGRGR